jgi:hypothetical protein
MKPPFLATIMIISNSLGAFLGGGLPVSYVYAVFHSSSSKNASHGMSGVSLPAFVIHMMRWAMIIYKATAALSRFIVCN